MSTAPAIRPIRHPDRWPAAACVLVAGATHIPLISDHLHEAPYIGALFIALVVVAAALTVALLTYDAPLVWGLVVAVMVMAELAFFLSRTIGLPQMPDDVGNWRGEAMGLPAITSEALAAAFGLTVLIRSRQQRTNPPSDANRSREPVAAYEGAGRTRDLPTSLGLLPRGVHPEH